MHQDSKATNTPRAVIRNPGQGPSHNVLGATHLYKLLPEETGGSLSLWEAIVPPGTGAPPHWHADEEEAFYVLEGAIIAELGAAGPRAMGPGSFFFAPRGVVHAFRNDGPIAARLLVLATPASGLVQMFDELDAAGAEGMPPVEKVVAIALRHGVAILPPD